MDNSPEAINAFGINDYFSRTISDFIPGLGEDITKEIPEQQTEDMAGVNKPDLSVSGIVKSVRSASPRKSPIKMGDEVDENLAAPISRRGPSQLGRQATLVGDEQEEVRPAKPSVLSSAVSGLRGRTVRGRAAAAEEPVKVSPKKAAVERVIDTLRDANAELLSEEGLADLEALAESAVSAVKDLSRPSVPVETQPTSPRTRVSPMKPSLTKVSPTKVSPTKPAPTPAEDAKAARIAKAKAAAAEKAKVARIARAKAAAKAKAEAARLARQAATEAAVVEEPTPVVTRRVSPTKPRPVTNVPEQVENPPPKTRTVPASGRSHRAAIIGQAAGNR